MKITVRTIFAFFILITTQTYAQNTTNHITHVRSVFQTINSDKTLKKVVVDNDKLSKIDHNYQPTDNGQELIGYFKNDTLVKIVNSVGLSFGIKTFEFYFENGKVLFIYERQQNFKFKKTGDLDTRSSDGFAGRYYLDQNKVIKKIETGNLIGEKGEAIKLLKSDIPAFSRMLLKANSK